MSKRRSKQILQYEKASIDDEPPWAAKRNVVFQQPSDRKVHLAGFREARPWRTGITVVNDHILVSAKAVSKSLPWGRAGGQAHKVSASSVGLVYDTMRHMIVNIRTQYLDVAVCVLHAPLVDSADESPGEI